MGITANEILNDWETFLREWEEHVEENGLEPFNPDEWGSGNSPTDQNPPTAYHAFLDTYIWDDDQTPEFVTQFGHSALAGLADNKGQGTEFFDRGEWETIIEDEVLETTGLSTLNSWPLNCLDWEEVFSEKESEWQSAEIEGTTYYYEEA